MLVALQLPPEGRAPRELTRRVRTLGLDTSHFRGRGWSRGETKHTHRGVARTTKHNAYGDEDVFVENSRAYGGPTIVPRLLALGWPYRCAWCGLADWRDQRLVLHLDHINGIHNDNRFGNLRLLCPNCHSQTPTYGNRRRPPRTS